MPHTTNYSLAQQSRKDGSTVCLHNGLLILEYEIDTFKIVQLSIDWHAIDGSIDCPAQSFDIADRSIARDIYIYIVSWLLGQN